MIQRHFIVFAMLCSIASIQCTDISSPQKEPPSLLAVSPILPPPPSPLTSTNLLSVSVDRSLLDVTYKRIYTV